MNKMILTVLVLGVSAGVMAHSGASGIVKERMDDMKEMSQASKAVARMFKAGDNFDKSLIIEAADSFVLHGEKITSLFPDTHASKMGTETEALPEIWDDWEGFSRMAGEFVESSVQLQTLIASTNNPEVIRKSFLKAAGSCRDCHDQFRLQ